MLTAMMLAVVGTVSHLPRDFYVMLKKDVSHS